MSAKSRQKPSRPKPASEATGDAHLRLAPDVADIAPDLSRKRARSKSKIDVAAGEAEAEGDSIDPALQSALTANCKRYLAKLAVEPARGRASRRRKTIVLAHAPDPQIVEIAHALRGAKIGSFQEALRTDGGEIDRAIEAKAIRTVEDFIAFQLEQASSDGVISLRAHFVQFYPVVRYGLLERYFERATFLFVSASDLLRSAAAVVTGLPTFDPAKTGALTPAEEKSFQQVLRHVTAAQDAWSRFFTANGIPALQVSYEEFAETPDDTRDRLIEYTGLPLRRYEPLPPVHRDTARIEAFLSRTR